MKEFERRERGTGEEEGSCKKVGDRRLRSGEEKRCNPDSFEGWAFVALGLKRLSKNRTVGTLC